MTAAVLSTAAALMALATLAVWADERHRSRARHATPAPWRRAAAATTGWARALRATTAEDEKTTAWVYALGHPLQATRAQAATLHWLITTAQRHTPAAAPSQLPPAQDCPGRLYSWQTGQFAAVIAGDDR